MKASKETRELPLYAINAKIMNNIDDLRESEELYKQLLNLYEKTQEEDNSFIGDLINSFNEQFEKMTNNFIFSNIMFKDGVLPKKLKVVSNESELSNKQYIIYPGLTKVKRLSEKQWNINDPLLKLSQRDESVDMSHIFKTNLHISRENILGLDSNLLEIKEQLIY